MKLNLLQSLASEQLDETLVDRITAAAKKLRGKGQQKPAEPKVDDIETPAVFRKEKAAKAAQAAAPAAPTPAVSAPPPPVVHPAGTPKPAAAKPAGTPAAAPVAGEPRTWEAYKKSGVKPTNPGAPDTKPGVSVEAAQHVTADFVKHLLAEWELFVSHGFKLTPALRGQVKQMALELGNFVKTEATQQSTAHLLAEIKRIQAQILAEEQ